MSAKVHEAMAALPARPAGPARTPQEQIDAVSEPPTLRAHYAPPELLAEARARLRGAR